MKRYIAKSLSLLLAGTALLALMLSSCSQELNVPGYEYVPEGEPARISIDVTVPAMSVQTRAVGNAGLDPDEERARAVNDLWIGIYNVSSGVRTGQQTIFNQVVSGAHSSYGTITINNILTLSGMSYIVAVANVSTVKGISLSDGSTGNLQDLLAKADTWEKYKSIVRVLDDPVIQRGSSLVMSGVYHETPDNKEAETVVAELAQSGTPPEVAIKPGEANDLPGRIHLRRLDSYIRVNLIPNSFINFTPKSWQIVNVPAVSYVHEQNGNGADRKPASQHLSEVTSVFEEDTYFKSERYVGGTFRRDETGVNWFFDFYQMENKHQGLEGTNSYDDREREYKTTDGKIDSNTGWYESLVTNPDLTKAPATTYVEDDANLANNNASYMIITGDLDYWIDGNNNPVASTTSDAIHRIAEATWTVHLGYCEGGDDESVKAKDFNCRRNTKYTYNIHIDGVDNIRVEAQKDGGEPQPGAEGIVNDIITDVYSLDAHYGVFNIQLTDNQRENFTWRIQAWFGGEPIDMIYGPAIENQNVGNMINLNDNKEMYEALPQNQFYNWIQIRPTSGPDVIAHYPGDIRLIGREIPYKDLNSSTDGLYPTDKIKDDVDGVWYLEDLRDLKGHPHPYDSAEGKEYPRWYTVFIDEYVWEYPIDWKKPSLTGRDDSESYMYNGEPVSKEKGIMDPTKWGMFVGEPNRRLWITSNDMYISKDRESVYNNAIYFVDQESVQTYYSEEASYGIGIESTNESYFDVDNPGNNESWTFTPYHGGSYNQVDGMINQFWYVQTYGNANINVRLKWDDIYKTESGKNRGEITYTFRKGHSHVRKTHSVMTYYIRDHRNEIMNACLSRNRDLNNDGLIGSNEIRWYLPTEKTYTRIILGAPSLRSPLFNINEYLPQDIVGGTGTPFSHYASSNNQQIWAEELAATGPLYLSGGNKSGNLRCIRNIGQPTNWTPDNDNSAYTSVDLAYEHNNTDRTITMKYYDNTTLRQTYYGPGEFIRSHVVGMIDSYAYPKFKYAKADCTRGTNGNIDESQLIANLNGGNVRMATDLITFYDNAGQQILDNANTVGGVSNMIRRLVSIDYWSVIVNSNDICRAYYEESNKSDLGTWRIPNITELGILKLLTTQNEQLINPGRNYISCSQEYFENGDKVHRYMVTWGETIGARYPCRNFYLRCVKDVR